MKPAHFWTLFFTTCLAGDLGFCRIATGDVTSQPVVAVGQPSQVLVRIGHPYRAERRRLRTSEPAGRQPKRPRRRKANP